MFSEIMRYILDLGPTVMLPIVIIIFSKLLGMKLGDCFKSGLHIGIGFVGIGLVIGLMLDSIGPAAKAMAEHFQINLHVIDIGWPGSSPMTLGVANRHGGDPGGHRGQYRDAGYPYDPRGEC